MIRYIHDLNRLVICIEKSTTKIILQKLCFMKFQKNKTSFKNSLSFKLDGIRISLSIKNKLNCVLVP